MSEIARSSISEEDLEGLDEHLAHANCPAC
jgi:hypothetical protein